ncbi:MAG TPA: hypothetical protein VN436_12820 [Holophaga sp.]|nr:hypothetical protein [Holophaga sp.]
MPGNIGINVGGTRIVRPGVIPIINASAMVPLNGEAYGDPGVIGPADGGIPGKVYTFSSFSEAQDTLRGGAILSYLSRIFRPSPDLAGAAEVKVVRIGSPTQATLAAAGLTFTSIDYGRHTNGISLIISAGSTTTWEVVIRKRGDGKKETWDVGLGIQVKSTATTPKLVFDHTNLQAKLYEGGAVVATLDYATEDVTLANLASWLNGRTGWTAKIPTGADSSMPVCFMNNPALADAPSISSSEYTSLPASAGMLYWLLRDRGTLATCALTSGTVYGELETLSEAYMTSGTGTALDTFELDAWNDALTLLETEDIQCVFACSTASTVRQACFTHCVTMRGVTRKRWRRFYTGSAPYETSSTACENAPDFDGPASYFWNGTTTTNPITGLAENLGGLGVAAQAVGMRCGAAPCISLTNKPVVNTELEFPQPTDTEINQCLIAGVSPVVLDPVTSRAVIVQGLTCYQGGSNVTYRKEQGLAVSDALSKLFQTALNDFVGMPMDLLTGQLLVQRLSRELDNVVRTAQNTDGFITKGRENGQDTPAWTALSVKGDGLETWKISVEVHPVGETAYIPVTCNLTPATISL